MVDSPELHAALTTLAANHHWTWSTRAQAVWDALPPAPGDRHPAQRVAELTGQTLARLGDDPAFTAAVAAELAEVQRLEAEGPDRPEIVYYSPEFGLSDLVPQYSGGLGILAGDHLKAASDLAVPLGAVGLFYREGFFRQLVVSGRQGERYETHDPADFGCHDTGLVIEIPMARRTVAARVWRLQVGRIRLLLLDTDLELNDPADRAITDRLYGGERRHRLEQEMVLGAGGWLAVEALDWTPRIHHLNEGHAGFCLLGLLASAHTAGRPLADSVEKVAPSVVFTTHTPVPAGIDRFDRALVSPYLAPWAERIGCELDELLTLAADPDEGPGVVNMAALCLRSAGATNGVSRLHGEVSRKLFAAIPGSERITSITNGVHARTWVEPGLQALFDDQLGAGWEHGDEAAWARVDDIDDETLRKARRSARTELAAILDQHTPDQLDPDACVVGFARRFATYKRADLLLRHPEHLARLLAADDRPLHFVFAGKAHPADADGKALLEAVIRYGTSPEARGRFTFVPDYHMGIARAMYGGCDVWLNNPVRPREASGTSGEKAALNGGLNCSIRDGWWAEMSDGRNGWDIAVSSATDPTTRDLEESANALAALAEVAAEFHAGGVPRSPEWIDRMRHGWRTLGPRVTASRMVREYADRLYGTS